MVRDARIIFRQLNLAHFRFNKLEYLCSSVNCEFLSFSSTLSWSKMDLKLMFVQVALMTVLLCISADEGNFFCL